MIGFYHRWQAEPLPRAVGERFATSLGLGGQRETGLHITTGPVFAATVAGKARGWKPAHTARGDVVLFMGHIENRAELRRLLERPASADDSTLYAAAFSQWGDAAELKVIGEFATILWLDADETLRLSRSPLGGPNLHIWHDDDRAIIASAARAIFATGEVEQRIDEQKIADSLFLNYNEGERGWFMGVSRLAKGSRAIITRAGIKTSRYYDLGALPDVRFKRDEDYVAAASALFEQGTLAALDGFSRPAVSISGGYDSQAVAAFALKVRPEGRVQGLTSVPEAGWDGQVRPHRFGNERPYVEAFAAMHPRFDTHWIDAAGLSFDHKLQAMFMLAGAAPRNAMNLHWIHEVSQVAKERGCDVVLTGAMGNATFSFDGSGALPGWFRRGAWLTLLRELRAADRETGFLRMAASRVMMPMLPKSVSGLMSRWWNGKEESVFESWCPLNPDWADEMNVVERAADMGFDPHFRGHSSTKAWRVAVMMGASNESGDIQTAMATLHGITRRDPTAYRPLVEFCMGIPDDQHLRNGQPRWLAQRMLRGMVPDRVLQEKRRGVQAADWHLRMGREAAALKDEVARLGKDPALARRLNVPMLESALADWPDKTPTGQQAMQLHLAVSRGLTTARFIRYVEGGNRH